MGMDIDINTAVLASRIYAEVRERYFVGQRPGDEAEADGGEVIAAIRKAIVSYMEETFRAS
jgi:hypothetical protein